MKKEKLKVGQTIWLKPSGNNRNMSITTAEITKSGTKYFWALLKGAHHPTEFEIARMCNRTDYTPSWYAHLTEQEVLDELEQRRLRDKMSRYFNNHKVPLDILKAVDEVLLKADASL